MTQKTVYPYGSIDVEVPYGQKIAISTVGDGYVTISYQTIGISPERFIVQNRISNEEVLLGTFSADRKVRIETKSSNALYSVGASPTVGVGDADTLSGLTASQFVRSDTDDNVDGILTFTTDIKLDNNKSFYIDNAAGTARFVMTIDNSNIFYIGNTNHATNLQSNGTLTYNGASLATGSIDTTASQTITVVDGLITAIA